LCRVEPNKSQKVKGKTRPAEQGKSQKVKGKTRAGEEKGESQQVKGKTRAGEEKGESQQVRGKAGRYGSDQSRHPRTSSLTQHETVQASLIISPLTSPNGLGSLNPRIKERWALLSPA
jgi:hypothetical protein